MYSSDSDFKVGTYFPMVLGSIVSWLSSTFKVVSFFNSPKTEEELLIGKSNCRAGNSI